MICVHIAVVACVTYCSVRLAIRSPSQTQDTLTRRRSESLPRPLAVGRQPVKANVLKVWRSLSAIGEALQELSSEDHPARDRAARYI